MPFSKHRLHAICPYFAMFPPEFAHRMIRAHSTPGQTILDPFCGRGTTLLEALITERQALALDVNPVAACISSAKARTPPLADLVKTLNDLELEMEGLDKDHLRAEKRVLPPFFGRAFYHSTLNSLIFLRNRLNWKVSDIDCFIAALILGSLHGEMDRSGSYFSNQMPRTISTKQAYSLRYWRARDLWPKKRDVFKILTQRARLRLTDSKVNRRGTVIHGDARYASKALVGFHQRVDLIVTSPPYLNVTNFEEDQWLRLWFLGGEPRPTYGRVSKDDRLTSPTRYWSFLSEVWKGIGDLLHSRSRIVCRIGGTGLTPDSIGQNLSQTVRSAWPTATLVNTPVASSPIRRQTDSFRPGSRGPGLEFDFVFQI